MTLSESDLKRARKLAAGAPVPGPELLARLRGILSGSVRPQAPAEPQTAKGGAADAA